MVFMSFQYLKTIFYLITKTRKKGIKYVFNFFIDGNIKYF